MTGNISKIYKSGLLSPAGLYRLAGAFMRDGVNLLALLRYAAARRPGRMAVTDDLGSITYGELYTRTLRLTGALRSIYGLSPGRRAAIVCRNHSVHISAIFAASATGADIFMISPEMSPGQLSALCNRHAFDLVICDSDVAAGLREQCPSVLLQSFADDGESVYGLCTQQGTLPLRHARAGNLVVLTGGTTGEHKTATRTQGVARFISPLLALITRADLASRRAVFMGTPIYHGFGLAGVFVAIFLGVELCLIRRFDAGAACNLVRARKADAAVLVPVMLQRMLAHDATALHVLKTIVAGGAPLSVPLANETRRLLGPVLFNLYGTSEAGFSLMATPADLASHPGSVGRPIRGVEMRITDAGGSALPPGTTGQLHLRNNWSANGAAGKWIATGDMAFRNNEGYCFLRGRNDDMIVSGGVNVYPIVLEQALLQHPQVRECAVAGVEDEAFGQRLVAFVVTNSPAEAGDLKEWLKDKVARYEMPRSISIVAELPYTGVGKPDRVKLGEMARLANG